MHSKRGNSSTCLALSSLSACPFQAQTGAGCQLALGWPQHAQARKSASTPVLR